MTDAFADVVMPIFQRMLRLLDQLAWEESRTAEEVLKQTRSWVEEGTRKTVAKPELARSFELAKYGLVSWIDEVLTESAWGPKVGWSVGTTLLEWEFYNKRLAATRFYEESDRAEDAGDMDALEVYLLCANLGFKGMKSYDEDELSGWVQRVYTRVSEAGSVASKPFAEDDGAAARFGPLRGPSLLVTVSSLVAFTALFTLGAYLLSVHLLYAQGG